MDNGLVGTEFANNVIKFKELNRYLLNSSHDDISINKNMLTASLNK